MHTLCLLVLSTDFWMTLGEEYEELANQTGWMHEPPGLVNQHMELNT
jgi:hypothetical protein